jgi:colanic acid/amylovoran biosynthesis protein
MKTIELNNRKTKICLLGAALDTGNMGVGALAEASIKCILNTWPDAEVTLLNPSRVAVEHHLKLLGHDVFLKKVPVRFSKNVFLSDHFFRFLLCAGLIRLTRSNRLRQSLAAHNQSLQAVLEADIVADITGGDSFSDIYGMLRFLQLTFLKLLILMLGKKLVLLPQTYGPFNRGISRLMARHVLSRASAIYSRDKACIDYVQDLLDCRNADNRIRFCPDVAFVLDTRVPAQGIPEELASIRANNNIIVGLNISGLLFGPDGTRDNQFGLAVPYADCIMRIIKMLLSNEKVTIILVPHVFSQNGAKLGKPHRTFAKAEADWSDTMACRYIYERVCADYSRRIFMIEGRYDQAEIKYIIGMCDFFIGSRMHSCIAALSQGIPAVGLAYSKKFQGVFESVGVESLVADMRLQRQDEILAVISNAFKKREAIREHLHKVIPEIQAQILNLFEDSRLQVNQRHL